MNIVRMILLAAFVTAATLISSGSAYSKDPVKGEEVKAIIYLKDGKLGGLMSAAGKKTWREDNDDGRFMFTELGRDEWSVYLLKKDGALVQVDLYTKKFYICSGPLSAEEMKNPTLALSRKTVLYTVAKAYR